MRRCSSCHWPHYGNAAIFCIWVTADYKTTQIIPKKQSSEKVTIFCANLGFGGGFMPPLPKQASVERTSKWSTTKLILLLSWGMGKFGHETSFLSDLTSTGKQPDSTASWHVEIWEQNISHNSSCQRRSWLPIKTNKISTSANRRLG